MAILLTRSANDRSVRPYSLAYSPDGRRIVTAAENGIARIWDAATGTLVHELVREVNRVKEIERVHIDLGATFLDE